MPANSRWDLIRRLRVNKRIKRSYRCMTQLKVLYWKRLFIIVLSATIPHSYHQPSSLKQLLSSYLCLGLSNSLFPSAIATKILAFLLLSCPTCTYYISLINLIIIKKLDKLLCFKAFLSIVIHSLVIFSFRVQNIIFNVLFQTPPILVLSYD